MMVRLIRVPTLLLLGMAVLACSCGTAACPLASSTLDEIEALVEDYVERDVSPGLLLGIRCGESMWVEAFGVSDISTGAPLETSHQFLVASLAKQFVAAVVMRLVEDGELALESRISNYIEDVPGAWTDITIRHCLNHTSGTFSFGTLPVDIGNGVLSSDAVIGFLTAGDLFFAPGEDFIYSTVGYFVLSYIVERITGESVDVYIEREFLEPLGMTETGFLANCPPENLAGYHQYYWRGQALVTDPPTTSWGLGDGMYSTARDLFAWQAALVSGRVVSEASYAMITERTETPGADGEAAVHDYGFGLEVFVDEEGELAEVGHWGNGGGHISRLWAYPSHDVVVVSLQNSNGRLAPLLDSIESVLLDSSSGEP
jgi:D-alanyl-D-alanine carboxypeptidase